VARAVLLADKTIPCPNKLGPFLAPDGARCRQPSLVGAFTTLVVTRWRILATKRQVAPNNAEKRQRAPENAKQRQETTARDEKRQTVSVGAVIIRAPEASEKNVRLAQLFEGQNR
jgi:hypothetical protein